VNERAVVVSLGVRPELHDVDQLAHVVAVLLTKHLDRRLLELDVFTHHNIAHSFKQVLIRRLRKAQVQRMVFQCLYFPIAHVVGDANDRHFGHFYYFD